MTTGKLDSFFADLLDIHKMDGIDSSLNGLQVDNDGGAINNIAFAVDACLESFKQAAAAGAGMLFVHHGLFWGQPLPLRGNHRRQIQFLLDHNIALYAVHLPLDRHPRWGNNAVLAERLGMENPEPFGRYHGEKIGFKGTLKEPLKIEDAVKRISFMDRPPAGVFPFGKDLNATAAVISGGAAMEALQAIDEGVDLYVTGESGHSVYHQALEGKLNMIAGGHYSTEVWGVRKVMEQCAAQLNLAVEFLDIPTGL
ncbi:GTP cyclohydrolase 1 type 2 [Spirochaetia bacterium]|nr:GTP cyclohydrolase 1 type 2 [Spirochaetia bacterium]